MKVVLHIRGGALDVLMRDVLRIDEHKLAARRWDDRGRYWRLDVVRYDRVLPLRVAATIIDSRQR